MFWVILTATLFSPNNVYIYEWLAWRKVAGWLEAMICLWRRHLLFTMATSPHLPSKVWCLLVGATYSVLFSNLFRFWPVDS